jgi:mRNA interferase RelE/StbE
MPSEKPAGTQKGGEKKAGAKKAGSAPPQHAYRLQFVPSAWAEWQRLDGSVKEPLRKLLKRRLDNPHVPGAALHGALAGHYKIKLNKQGYRLVYGVQDDVLIVMVMAVEKREDRLVYQSAVARVSEQVTALARMVQKRSKP